MEERMKQALNARRQKGTLRSLVSTWNEAEDSIDFSSNDYLGLAHDPEQARLVERERMTGSTDRVAVVLGATGSRLLSGDSNAFHHLEDFLARVHNRPAAILCNSGYDANLTVVSCLPSDVIVSDEYAHNSLHMGMRLFKSQTGTGRRVILFKHNSVEDLRRQLSMIQKTTPSSRVVVLIESVYSMDGDVAPVKYILDTAADFGAHVIVDEAHGLGVYGRSSSEEPGDHLPGTGVLSAENVEHHLALLCSIHTFGKAAGCHGAVLCFATTTHKEYVINYGYPFIYSTALPLHSLIAIRCSYETMMGEKGNRLRTSLRKLVHLFRCKLRPLLPDNRSVFLLPSTSPIQALIVPGNHTCARFCAEMFEASGRRIRLFPIKSPTVPVGQERVRIIIHASNSRKQVELLVRLVLKCLKDMELLDPKPRL
jgi:8-amino-7-oxononanoate synthase